MQIVRIVAIALLAGCGSTAPAPVVTPPEPGPGPGVHGMVIFGERATYLSHLPMFHEPHDYQVLLAVRLGGDAAAARLADAEASGAHLYTFVPEPFVLTDAKVGFVMTGDVVRGHFERGGKKVLTGVEATIERVIEHRRFVPASPDDEVTLRYRLFGADGEYFLAHHITSPPDFDHIVALRSVDNVDEHLRDTAPLLRFYTSPEGEPLPAGEVVDAAIEGSEARHRIEVGDELYLERNELAR